jgi:hypothetical protein
VLIFQTSDPGILQLCQSHERIEAFSQRGLLADYGFQLPVMGFNRALDLFVRHGCSLRIPMMSISCSEVMAISAERSDARLFQCETVIDIRQGVCWFSVLFICLFFRR